MSVPELPLSAELARFQRERPQRRILGALGQILKAKQEEDDFRHWYHEVWMRCVRHGIAEVAHGKERIAFIDPKVNLVLKVRLNQHVGQAFQVEREVMAQVDPKWQEHLPRTWFINADVIIQECVKPDEERYNRLFKSQRELWERRLGVRDLHWHNVGWRGDTPVFIDLALRATASGVPIDSVNDDWCADTSPGTPFGSAYATTN